MIVSIPRKLRAVLVAAAAVWPAAAAAQLSDDSQPLVIVPLEEPETLEAPAAPLPEVVDETAPPDGDAVASEDDAAPGLEIEELETVSTHAAGTLRRDGGGFGLDMWQGSDGALVARLLAGVEGVRSATMADLARRLLLSAASEPEGEAGDLLGLRLDRLLAIGRQDEIAGLVASAGQSALSPAARRTGIEGLFLGGDNTAACRAVRDALAAVDDDAIALAFSFCQRLAGQHAAADLGLAVLSDSGVAVPARYIALHDALAGGPPVAFDSFEDLSPLAFAMTLAAGGEIDAKRLASAPLSILRAVSTVEALPLETRLFAAERAVAAGAMTGVELAALYLSAPFAEDEISNALEAQGPDLAGPRGRALLYRAARKLRLPIQRAEAVSVLLRRAALEDDRVGAAVARSLAGPIAALSPDGDLAWFAGSAVVALLASGAPADAAPWWRLLEMRAESDEMAAAQAALLWPVYRIALGESLDDDGTRMRRWWAALAERREIGSVAAQAELYMALLQAFDDPAADSLVFETLTAPRSPDAAATMRPGDVGRLVALEAAARGGRMGETVLLALTLIGDAPSSGVHPVALSGALRALRAVGLEREARLLALEAALLAHIL